MSGTCRKLLLLGLETSEGGEGAARAKISATGTWEEVHALIIWNQRYPKSCRPQRF